MKLDPGMHIGMHLVFFGKSGVTPPVPTIPNSKVPNLNSKSEKFYKNT
jgi:hypothetical protein